MMEFARERFNWFGIRDAKPEEHITATRKYEVEVVRSFSHSSCMQLSVWCNDRPLRIALGTDNLGGNGRRRVP